MNKVAVFTLAAALFGAMAPVASATPSVLDGLVAQCSREASRSHERAWRLEPSLRPTIEAHRDLMSAACARWLSAEKTEVLLSQCLTQAASGPRHIQDGRNVDLTRIERQQELCRKIAARRPS
jgi:hypothetical protein